MYPQIRVFDPVLKSASFDLPVDSPYVDIDTSGGAVVVTADALALVPGGYSAMMTFMKVTTDANTVTLECPSGWTTPSGLNTDFVLPDSAIAQKNAWSVLYDAEEKAITLLNAASSSSSGAGPEIPAPHTFVGPGLVHVGLPSGEPNPLIGPITEFDDAGLVLFDEFDNLDVDIAFTLSKITTGTNGAEIVCPTGWTVNGVLNTNLILPGSNTAFVGAWLVYTVIASLRIVVRPAS